MSSYDELVQRLDEDVESQLNIERAVDFVDDILLEPVTLERYRRSEHNNYHPGNYTTFVGSVDMLWKANSYDEVKKKISQLHDQENDDFI